ncbi:hypothetical protein [Microbacterium sp. KNMS]
MATTTSKGYPFPEPPDPDKPRSDIQVLAEAIDQTPGIRAVTTAERDVLTNLWRGMVIFNLTTSRLEVNLSGTAGDWEWVVNAMSTRPLPVANGGTGLSVAPSLLVNLESTEAASPLQNSPRPGVRGVLPVANGGTGGADAAAARNQLGVPSALDVGNTETDFVAAFNTALAAP